MDFWRKFTFRWQLLVALIISFFVGFAIHTHLDEFILFADLAYRNPNFYLNKFPNGYQAYVKLFPLGLSANLPYTYVGNLQGYLFLPFYLLFPIELAKFAYSLVSLCIIAYLLITEFKLKGANLWVITLFLPFYMTILHDSGPVNIAIITFFLSKRLVERNFNKENIFDRIINVFLLALLWSLAFYDKHFFLYLFPAVFIFSFANINLEKLFTLKSIYILFSAILFLAFAAFYLKGNSQIKTYVDGQLVSQIVPTKLLLGGSPDVFPLAKFILHFPDSIQSWPLLDKMLQERLATFAAYLNSFDFSFYLIRNLNLKNFMFISIGGNFPITIPLFFAALFIVSIRFIVKVANRGIYMHEYKTLIYFFSFITLTFTLLVLGKVRSPHHFIFIWIPLFGMFFDNNFRSNWSYVFIPYIVISFSLCSYNLLFSGPEEHIIDDYSSIVPYTKRDDPNLHIVNFDGWSHSYTRMVDNPNHHIVTWTDLRDERQLNQLIYLSDSLKTPIIEVSSRLDWGHEEKPLSTKERMKFFESKGFIVKQINHSINLPIYLIKR